MSVDVMLSRLFLCGASNRFPIDGRDIQACAAAVLDAPRYAMATLVMETHRVLSVFPTT